VDLMMTQICHCYRYEWYADDVRIQASDKYDVVDTARGASVLTIRTDHIDQSTNVQCWCRNEAGTAFSNVTTLRPAGR